MSSVYDYVDRDFAVGDVVAVATFEGNNPRMVVGQVLSITSDFCTVQVLFVDRQKWITKTGGVRAFKNGARFLYLCTPPQPADLVKAIVDDLVELSKEGSS